jgi:hypothetical protein
MQDRDAAEDALAEYVRSLSTSLQQTSRAEDRPAYVSHLAQAARLFAAIRAMNQPAVEDILLAEERSFGWGFLSGEGGGEVEAAFSRLCALVRGR